MSEISSRYNFITLKIPNGVNDDVMQHLHSIMENIPNVKYMIGATKKLLDSEKLYYHGIIYTQNHITDVERGDMTKKIITSMICKRILKLPSNKDAKNITKHYQDVCIIQNGDCISETVPNVISSLSSGLISGLVSGLISGLISGLFNNVIPDVKSYSDVTSDIISDTVSDSFPNLNKNQNLTTIFNASIKNVMCEILKNCIKIYKYKNIPPHIDNCIKFLQPQILDLEPPNTHNKKLPKKKIPIDENSTKKLPNKKK